MKVNFKVMGEVLYILEKSSYKRKRGVSDAIDLEILRQLKESPEDRYGNEDTLFGQSIAASLSRMEAHKKSMGSLLTVT